MEREQIKLPDKNKDGSYNLDQVYMFIDRMRHNGNSDPQIAFLLGVETHRLYYFDSKRRKK